jgi:hypothetical protein
MFFCRIKNELFEIRIKPEPDQEIYVLHLTGSFIKDLDRIFEPITFSGGIFPVFSFSYEKN